MSKRVLVGLSGGVDSALTAALLQRRGYEVTGLYCIMHDTDPHGLKDAHRVADFLRIPLRTTDLRTRFDRIVVSDFLNNYAQAKTPNPCIICNPQVKFKALCEEADALGIETIATGHYASVGEENGRFFVRAVADKDQSYMLCRLTQEQLSRILFPLSDTTKEENRVLAQEWNIPVFHKPDSQDICFIRGGSYVDYIERRLGTFPEGDFWLKEEDRAVGTHKGLIRYTIGQRKNLGIALGTPVYVHSLEKKNNRVVLSRSDVVDCREITAFSPVYQRLNPEEDKQELRAYGKIRFAAKASPCTLSVYGDRLNARFDEPQRAATPGQSAVFYDEKGSLLCSGLIDGTQD